MLEASLYISTNERCQDLKIACPEEIPFRSGWIDTNQLEKLAAPLIKDGYGVYLTNILKEKAF
jgi:glucose-1-phosphate thymidylyltransferase